MSTAALATAVTDRDLIQRERRHRSQALARCYSPRRGRPLIPCHFRPRAATRQRRSNPRTYPSLAHAPLSPRRRPSSHPPPHPPLAHVPILRPAVALQPSVPTSPIPVAPSPAPFQAHVPDPRCFIAPSPRRPAYLSPCHPHTLVLSSASCAALRLRPHSPTRPLLPRSSAPAFQFSAFRAS